jgi:CHAT domain-containing protein
VSFDRRLRYLPFAALFDGEKYAVQHFDVAMLSAAGYEIAGRKVTGAPIAALGTTRAVGGFPALPGVGIELDGIIRGADGFGLFDGKVELDKDFDKTALEDALRVGASSPEGVGIVHISSHFALGETDAKSFLVLGTGDTLDLQEVKRNRRAFDFGRVDLLTLSACATGYADPALDGREMESLSQLTGSRGARAILATLWPVEDNSTAVLMQRFYELRERAGNSKAHALALTQREFIEGDVGSEQNLAGQSIVFETAVRGAVPIKPPAGEPQLGLAHPFYWAPFVLTGNWR